MGKQLDHSNQGMNVLSQRCGTPLPMQHSCVPRLYYTFRAFACGGRRSKQSM